MFKSGYRYERLETLNNKSLQGDLDVPLKSDWDKEDHQDGKIQRKFEGI